MSDAAIFKATFSGLRSLADGDYRISFDFIGEELATVTQILTQGGKPSAARGTWFAIARLSGDQGAAPSTRGSLENTQGTDSTLHSDRPVSELKPARALSQNAGMHCNDPAFRRFLENTRGTAIPSGCHINDYQGAHDVLCAWLGVSSLKELNDDPILASDWVDIRTKFNDWKNAPRYVEAQNR